MALMITVHGSNYILIDVVKSREDIKITELSKTCKFGIDFNSELTFETFESGVKP